MSKLRNITLTLMMALSAIWPAHSQTQIDEQEPALLAPVAPVPPLPPTDLLDAIPAVAPRPRLLGFRGDVPDLTPPALAGPPALARPHLMGIPVLGIPGAPPLPPEPMLASRMALPPGVMFFAGEKPPKPPRPDDDDRLYDRGQRDLERNRWDQALESFSEAASHGGARADGALYWKAYALNKMGRRDDAVAALAELRKTYPASRWLDDAKALEVEVRQSSGKPVSPESATDEDLKVMALNGLMNSDPERALPLLEKLLHSSQSPKIKERALFVLTQSDSTRAKQLVVDMAKGASNPDLQMKAVHYLGVMDGKKQLGEVYSASNDVGVKRAVLRSLMVAGAQDQLLAAAKGEKNPDLRREAIRQLGVMGAHGELWQLYQVEPAIEAKREIVNALFVGGDSDHMLEIARTAKEPELRRDSIRALGNMGEQKAGNALAAMYAGESDLAIRKEIIRALFVQGNGHALVEIARKETNIDLKKEIVRNLSNMQSKEGTEYLMELLNK